MQAQLISVLKQNNMSITSPRQIVFEVLSNNEPLTMTELIAACESAIDKASVYRTVSLYEHLGVVQRLQIGWKYKLELSNDFQPHHHHLTCIRCHRMITLPENNDLERHFHHLAKLHGFTNTDHQLEIKGICPECQATNVQRANLAQKVS
jgi:Fur family ferric uptake transcriptional regulator